MMDIGFQNLSRVMASDKPIRVVVVDTQAYSTTGGQACTAGFTGQVSDMAEYGPGPEGQGRGRKELALIAMAHRGAFVMQSSQATPSHLFKNLLKGLQVRRPALFILNAPCPREWGIARTAHPKPPDWRWKAARYPTWCSTRTRALHSPNALTWRATRPRGYMDEP